MTKHERLLAKIGGNGDEKDLKIMTRYEKLLDDIAKKGASGVEIPTPKDSDVGKILAVGSDLSPEWIEETPAI